MARKSNLQRLADNIGAISNGMSANAGGTPLYDMSAECFRFYQGGACQKHTLGYCQGCALDLAPHVGDNKAKLMKFERAYKEARWKAEDRGMLIYCLILIGAIAGCMLLGILSSCSTAKTNAYILTDQLSPVKVDTGIQMVNVPDHNGDGLHNCIDASIEWYNNHKGYEIVVNVNPKTGMNHAFVRKFGTTETIEPQNGLPMKVVWGAMYDPKYDRSTSVYYGFCKAKWKEGAD
jgi:hypothetical protein